MKVLGPPPANVRYRRWMWNEDKKEMEIVVIGAAEEKDCHGVDEKSDQSLTPQEIEKDV